MTNWADQLIIEYEESRKSLHAIKNNLGDSELDKLDKTQINSMINDMSFSIDWMKLGRRPGNLRGIDKRSAYQRRVLVDMDLFPSLDIQPENQEISDETKEMLVNILIDLSHRERQCYLLHMAQGWSLSEIAKEIGIAKRTVQQYVDRAKDKVSANMEKVS